MKRELYGLRFETTQSSRQFDEIGDQVIILGYEHEEWPLPPDGKEWCDVHAGDVITEKNGETHTVIAVRLYLAQGGDPGTQVVSGRDWLEAQDEWFAGGADDAPCSGTPQATCPQPAPGRLGVCARVSTRYPQPGRRLDERKLLAALKRVTKRLGLPGHIHTFRHTFISVAVMKNIPEAVLRKWVGHIDPAILRYYTHISDTSGQREMQRLAAENGSAIRDASEAENPEK